MVSGILEYPKTVFIFVLLFSVLINKLAYVLKFLKILNLEAELPRTIVHQD